MSDKDVLEEVPDEEGELPVVEGAFCLLERLVISGSVLCDDPRKRERCECGERPAEVECEQIAPRASVPVVKGVDVFEEVMRDDRAEGLGHVLPVRELDHAGNGLDDLLLRLDSHMKDLLIRSDDLNPTCSE